MSDYVEDLGDGFYMVNGRIVGVYQGVINTDTQAGCDVLADAVNRLYAEDAYSVRHIDVFSGKVDEGPITSYIIHYCRDNVLPESIKQKAGSMFQASRDGSDAAAFMVKNGIIDCGGSVYFSNGRILQVPTGILDLYEDTDLERLSRWIHGLYQSEIDRRPVNPGAISAIRGKVLRPNGLRYIRGYSNVLYLQDDIRNKLEREVDSYVRRFDTGFGGSLADGQGS